jgi:hypothetical protein
MSAPVLHAGDHFTPVGYNVDLTFVAVTDHIQDAIGHEIIEAIGPDDVVWLIWDGIVVRGGHR